METPAPTATGRGAPAVVAVVVTRDPGPWLESAAEALAAQDYPNLAVLVIDSASEVDPTPRIAAVLPDAYVRRLDENRGYGAAANHVTDIVDGAAFYCFLHDDAAPEPDAIHTMVNEAVRSNAGIVGAKIVQFEDHRRLLQVGESVDKTGERSSIVDRGELDQEQYDGVRDAFLATGGCVLVRADLFDAIGGFDDGIDLLNDDLNLCWRAHVAGARVLLAPDAVVGHVEALGDRSPVEERRVRLVRHRVRTMLVCYSRWHLLRVLPQAMLFAVAEVVYSVLVGRRGQAGDIISAWRWNWQRRDEIKAWRARVEEFRGVPDAEIRRFQVRGFARVNAFLRGQTSRGGSRSEVAQAAWARAVDGVRSGALRWPIAAWIVTLAIVGFGSRHLLFRPIAAVGGFAPFDLGVRDLVDAYLADWRTVGLGASAAAPTAFGLLAGAGALLLGSMGLLRQLLVVGSLLAGFVGAYRLVRPAASPIAQAIALVVYAAIPIGYDAVAEARLDALVVYAATPWLVAQLARAARWAPFDASGYGVHAAGTAPRVASVGLLVALVAAFEPAVVMVAALVAVALVLGSLLVGQRHGLGPLVVAAVGGSLVAIVLHLPWTLEFVLPGATWELVVGPEGADAAPRLADLLRFDVGPVGGGALAVGLPLASLLPLLIGREWRFEWAVRGWTLALVPIALLWADGQGWTPLHLPAAEILLAPAAAGFAIAASMGLVAFQVDLRAYGFGWRQVAAGASAIAFLVGAFPTLLDAGNGRWYLPAGGLDTTFAFLDDESAGSRVLWIGDPDVLPLASQPLEIDGIAPDGGGVAFATSDGGLPSLTDAWPGPPDSAVELLGDALRLAVDDETARLGELLAPMAVRYIVLPNAAAPQPLGGVQRPRSEVLLETLADQLDLAQVAVNPAFVVYRNEAAFPRPATVAATAGDTAFELGLEPAGEALVDRTGPTSFDGSVDAGTRILVGSASDGGWELEVGGEPVPAVKLFGWAQGFEPVTGGDAVLRHRTSPLRYGVLVFQLLGWLLVLRVARRVRRRGEGVADVGPVLAPPTATAAAAATAPPTTPDEADPVEVTS